MKNTAGAGWLYMQTSLSLKVLLIKVKNLTMWYINDLDEHYTIYFLFVLASNTTNTRLCHKQRDININTKNYSEAALSKNMTV